MAKIIFITHDGQEQVADIAEGWSLMEGAVKNGVPGIDADCGGACACATCHVYVDPAWTAALPAKSDSEEAMLDFALATSPNSRLSCQIKVTPELDGLIVRVPVSQH
jgi:2Fe-2S ferredoxin